MVAKRFREIIPPNQYTQYVKLTRTITIICRHQIVLYDSPAMHDCSFADSEERKPC